MTRNIVLVIIAILAAGAAVIKLSSVVSVFLSDAHDLCAIGEGDGYGS